jgi:hypothetical protein
MTTQNDELEVERLKLEYRLARLEAQESAQKDFMLFTKYVWPEAIIGDHHAKMADAFNRVMTGKLKRLIINMPPRHTKSEFASYLLPAFIMGNKPRTKIIQATHTGELAVRFGRKVRNLMDSDEYKEIYPRLFCRLTPRPPAGGTRTKVANTSLLASVVQ